MALRVRMHAISYEDRRQLVLSERAVNITCVTFNGQTSQPSWR
jgi:hypothetical protein